MSKLGPFSLLALSLFAQPAAAIYKCVGADGRLAFQDRPCPAGQQQTRTDTESATRASADPSVSLWTLRAGSRAVVIGLPSHWQGKIRQQGVATTLRARSDTEETELLLVTALARTEQMHEKNKLMADLRRAIRSENQAATAQATLTELPFHPVMMAGAASGAYLVTGPVSATTAADARQYAFAVVGGLITDSTMIHFRLLTDDPQSDDASMTLASLQMLVEEAGPE